MKKSRCCIHFLSKKQIPIWADEENENEDYSDMFDQDESREESQKALDDIFFEQLIKNLHGDDGDDGDDEGNDADVEGDDEGAEGDDEDLFVDLENFTISPFFMLGNLDGLSSIKFLC